MPHFRWLEEQDASSSSASSQENLTDAFPPSTAFLAAGAILGILVLATVLLVGLEYARELDLRFFATSRRNNNERDTHHGGGGRRDTLGRSFLFNDSASSSVLWSSTRTVLLGSPRSSTETSVKEGAILSVEYNFQTLFLALVQASLSMLLLGGIQVDFQLTCLIFFSLVILWTVLMGVLLTLWMASVAYQQDDQNNNNSSALLRELKLDLQRDQSMSFLRHFVEVSWFHPMIHVERLAAGDIYQDIGRNGTRTFLLGIGQLILLGMYTWSIVDDGKPDLTNVRLYSYYCCGIVMQIAYLSGQDVLYKSFSSHLSFWGNVLCAARKGYAYSWEPPQYLLYHRPRIAFSGSIKRFNSQAVVRLKNTPFLWVRFFLSTVVNMGGLIIITLLLPLQLASNEDPLAFVLSAIGAYYILSIDDYNEPVTYTLVRDAPEAEKLRDLEMAPATAFRNMGDDEIEPGAVTTPPKDMQYSFYTSY